MEILEIFLQTKFMIILANFKLLEERRICSGRRDYMQHHLSVENCYQDCRDGTNALWFTFGTNDFGSNECDENNGCPCFCEMEVNSDTSECALNVDNGFYLYEILGITF